MPRNESPEIHQLLTALKIFFRSVAICPITQLIMKDPMITPDGYCYEREAILNYLHTHDQLTPRRVEIPPHQESEMIVLNRKLQLKINEIEEFLNAGSDSSPEDELTHYFNFFEELARDQLLTYNLYKDPVVVTLNRLREYLSVKTQYRTNQMAGIQGAFAWADWVKSRPRFSDQLEPVQGIPVEFDARRKMYSIAYLALQQALVDFSNTVKNLELNELPEDYREKINELKAYEPYIFESHDGLGEAGESLYDFRISILYDVCVFIVFPLFYFYSIIVTLGVSEDYLHPFYYLAYLLMMGLQAKNLPLILSKPFILLEGLALFTHFVLKMLDEETLLLSLAVFQVTSILLLNLAASLFLPLTALIVRFQPERFQREGLEQAKDELTLFLQSTLLAFLFGWKLWKDHYIEESDNSSELFGVTNLQLAILYVLFYISSCCGSGMIILRQSFLSQRHLQQVPQAASHQTSDRTTHKPYILWRQQSSVGRENNETFVGFTRGY